MEEGPDPTAPQGVISDLIVSTVLIFGSIIIDTLRAKSGPLSWQVQGALALSETTLFLGFAYKFCVALYKVIHILYSVFISKRTRRISRGSWTFVRGVVRILTNLPDRLAEALKISVITGGGLGVASVLLWTFTWLPLVLLVIASIGAWWAVARTGLRFFKASGSMLAAILAFWAIVLVFVPLVVATLATVAGQSQALRTAIERYYLEDERAQPFPSPTPVEPLPGGG